LDPNASATKEAQNAFVNPAVTANYTLAWLLGAKRVHDLNIDYMGQWNERDAPKPYNDALRLAVNSSTLASTTTVLNRLPHYPGTAVAADPQGCTQYPWNTTDGSRWVDEEGSIFDARSARCLARCVNRGYVTGCHTATFQWHLISSFYDYLPWHGARFRQKFTLEDAIGSHACSLEANTRVTNGIPLGSSLLLPVDTVNCVQTLKGARWCCTVLVDRQAFALL
jgi:hypothetical protein